MSHGANIHARHKSQTPLHIVSRWGKNEMAEYLLKNGAGTEKRDWLSWTPIMWASLLGKSDMVKTLIDWGANVNVKDVDRNTPLILSVWRGHADTTMLLISHNADLYAVNKDGLNAAGVAKKHEFYKLSEKLNSLAGKETRSKR